MSTAADVSRKAENVYPTGASFGHRILSIMMTLYSKGKVNTTHCDHLHHC